VTRPPAGTEAELANGIGNLVARVLNLVEKYGITAPTATQPDMQIVDVKHVWDDFTVFMNSYRLDRAYGVLRNFARNLDAQLELHKPWTKAMDPELRKMFLWQALESLRHLTWMISVFQPTTAEKIWEQMFPAADERAAEKEKSYNKKVSWGGIKSDHGVKRGEGLFPRLN